MTKDRTILEWFQVLGGLSGQLFNPFKDLGLGDDPIHDREQAELIDILFDGHVKKWKDRQGYRRILDKQDHVVVGSLVTVDEHWLKRSTNEGTFKKYYVVAIKEEATHSLNDKGEWIPSNHSGSLMFVVEALSPEERSKETRDGMLVNPPYKEDPIYGPLSTCFAIESVFSIQKSEAEHKRSFAERFGG